MNNLGGADMRRHESLRISESASSVRTAPIGAARASFVYDSLGKRTQQRVKIRPYALAVGTIVERRATQRGLGMVNFRQSDFYTYKQARMRTTMKRLK